MGYLSQTFNSAVTASLFAIAATAVFGSNSTVANAQENPSAEPENLAAAGSDIRVGYLVSEFGLSEADAIEQLQLTDRFGKQIDTLASTFPEAYLKTIYQYGTPFRIDVVFSRDVAANELQQAVSSELRPVVKVKRSRFTRDEIMGGKTRIMGLLRPVLSSVGASFNFDRDRYIIYVLDDASERLAKAALTPDLRKMVDYSRAPGTTGAGYDTAMDDPTHNGRGSIWGGWQVRSTDSKAICSSNFIATDTVSNLPMLLTAAHCGSSAMKVRFSDGSTKDLTEPLAYRNGGHYDFQGRWGPYLTTDGYFWIDNDVSGSFKHSCDVAGNNCQTKNWRNLYGGVASTGYVAVKNVIKGNYASSWGWNDNHPINDPVCKNGNVTGVTCGRVVDSEYDYDDEGSYYTNLVRVKIGDTWGAAGSKGDSGGSVFKITSSAGTFPEATAVGIISGGTFRTSGTLKGYVPCSASVKGECFLIYMPIDRINDNAPIAIDIAGSSIPMEVD